MRLITTGSFAFMAMLQVASAQDSHLDLGRSVALRRCGQCHAIGVAGPSRHRAAPPFRRLGERISLDTFDQHLGAGIIAGHPDMPLFLLKGKEAQALVAYVRSVQAK